MSSRRARCSARAATSIEEFLPRFGVASTLVDGARPRCLGGGDAARRRRRSSWRARPTRRWNSSTSRRSPAIAHEAGATLVVDNVFATPILQRPLELGADCVVYSATKHIDGQGRCLGGVVLGSAGVHRRDLHTFLRQTGPAMSPFNAWVLLKGLETLPCASRARRPMRRLLADALAGDPEIARLIYPGRPDHPQADIVAPPDERRLAT